MEAETNRLVMIVIRLDHDGAAGMRSWRLGRMQCNADRIACVTQAESSVSGAIVEQVAKSTQWPASFFRLFISDLSHGWIDDEVIPIVPDSIVNGTVGLKVQLSLVAAGITNTLVSVCTSSSIDCESGNDDHYPNTCHDGECQW